MGRTRVPFYSNAVILVITRLRSGSEAAINSPTPLEDGLNDYLHNSVTFGRLIEQQSHMFVSGAVERVKGRLAFRDASYSNGQFT